MQMNNGIGLRESLEQLETAGLDELLRTELEKEIPDADTVRLVMSILEQRNKATATELTPSQEAAWQRYHQRMEDLAPKLRPFRKWIAAAASVVLVLGLLFTTLPQQAQAESFWQMVQRWSGTVLSYFGKEDRFRQTDYVFVTENEGLQQVYDTLVELGIRDPIVPTWFPEQYKLSEFEFLETPALQSIHTRFLYSEHEIIYDIDLYMGEFTRQFYRDDNHYESYEKNGTTYNITRNANWWVVVWTKDNIECSLTLDCQEDTLRRILKSIYVTED